MKSWMVYALLAVVGVGPSMALLFAALVRANHRGEVSGVPEQPELSEQTCAINAAGLSKENAEVLRRNYQPMSEEDRSELNITFLSIVNPEGVPE